MFKKSRNYVCMILLIASIIFANGCDSEMSSTQPEGTELNEAGSKEEPGGAVPNNAGVGKDPREEELVEPSVSDYFAVEKRLKLRGKI